jgi:hypothetical protein
MPMHCRRLAPGSPDLAPEYKTMLSTSDQGMNTGELSRPGQLKGSAPSVMPSGSTRKAIRRPTAAARAGTVTVTKASSDRTSQAPREACTAMASIPRLMARLTATDPVSRYRSS